MNASKEECAKVISKLTNVRADCSNDIAITVSDITWDFVFEFLEAAYKKLPSEKSFKSKEKKKGWEPA